MRTNSNNLNGHDVVINYPRYCNCGSLVRVCFSLDPLDSVSASTVLTVRLSDVPNLFFLTMCFTSCNTFYYIGRRVFSPRIITTLYNTRFRVQQLHVFTASWLEQYTCIGLAFTDTLNYYTANMSMKKYSEGSKSRKCIHIRQTSEKAQQLLPTIGCKK